jgi:hypothetical protein
MQLNDIKLFIAVNKKSTNWILQRQTDIFKCLLSSFSALHRFKSNF